MKLVKTAVRVLAGLVIVCSLLLIAGRLYTFYLREAKGESCPTVLGIGSAVVISGSMEDAISINDMIITVRQKAYHPGDIVMYETEGHPVTHRIVDKAGDAFITKGDANNTADSEPVPVDKIAGKVVWIIPGAGVVLSFMQTPLGMMLMLFAAFALLVLPNLFRKQ